MILIFGIVGLAAIFNFISFLLKRGSIQSIFGGIYFLQMMLLVPMTGLYVPTKVSEAIHAMRPALLSFYFLNCDEVSLNENDLGECGHSQTNPLLHFIGLQSKSTLINAHIVILIFLVVFVWHVLTLLFSLCIKSESEGCWARFIRFNLKIMQFPFYIRYTLPCLMLVSLASVSEAEKADTDTTSKLRSFIYSLVAVGYLCLFFIVSLVHWIKYAGEEDLEESRFFQLYETIKPFRWARTYSLVFMLKRVALATFLILGDDFGKSIRLGVLVGVQAAYCIYLFVIRPFITPKDNIVEMVPELGFLLLSGGFNYYERVGRWSSNIEWVFWTAIIAILSIYAFFSFGKFPLIYTI